VKLIPTPEYKKSMMAVFKDINMAAKTVADIIKNGIIPATLEILDKITINAVEDYKKIGLPKDAEAILLIETDGIKESAEKETGKIINICKLNQAIDISIAKDDAERDKIWEARRSALPALGRVKPTCILEDATVPRSRVPDMIKAINDIAKKYNILIGTFGHAGDGNLHPTIITDERNKEEMARVEKAIDEIFESALKLNGTLTGEHGIGVTKMKYLQGEFGKAGVEAMRRVKKALDPNNIFNPGKILA
jgi:glycolate oxidase